MKAPAACNITTLHLNWSPQQFTLHAAIHYRATRTPIQSQHEAGSLCSTAHLGLCMKFIAPCRRCVFTLQLKGKDRACGLKAVSSWPQTPEVEVNVLYLCLHWAVYPSNVQTAMRTPRDHQFLFCTQLSLLLPTHTNIKRLIHTNVHSAASVRWWLPLHLSVRRWKTSERKRKKEVTRFTVKTTFKCFQEFI